jgi:hypothetical protein
MKYQINKNPQISVVPIIELSKGLDGVIKHSGIYPDSSVLHSDNNMNDFYAYNLMHYPDYGIPKRLSHCNDKHLERISRICNYPIEELKEIRKLERQARAKETIKS